MTRDLLAPLSPPQEVALRRIAHGSFVIDPKIVSRLIALALVERTSGGMRLTPLGQLRFNALPKAPLLARPRSVHAVTGYVEGLIEKAQSRSMTSQPDAEEPAPMPAAAWLLPESDEDGGRRSDESEELPVCQPIHVFFDSEHWKARAENRIARMRRAIMEHRLRQVRLCDASERRIESSRVLLKKSVPLTPGAPTADK